MLRKLSEIEVKPDSPFDDDALCRQEPIEILTKLVQSTRQPFVLSVEASWVFGKTTFLRLWKAYLEAQNHVCLYFNAWETDFVDDPLVAFLGEMRRFVDEAIANTKENEPIKADWDKVKRIGGGVLRKTLPLAIQIATHGILSQKTVKDGIEALSDEADKIGEFAGTLAKERLKKYEAEKTGIVGFRESLEKLASEITEHTGKRPPMVFFVDELDRCRPDFAVALLERIKHLFNAKNVVFVLAIDRGQLNESVKALYGAGMQPDGYLRRFIDLAYQLPEPEADRFASRLFHRFSFGELGQWYGIAESFLGSFSQYARAFGLSLRAQEQCFTEMNIALRINPAIRQFPYALSFLATLRTYRPGIVEQLRGNQVEVETVMQWISNVDREDCKLYAEATLLTEFPHGETAAKRLRTIDQLCGVSPTPAGQEAAVTQAKEIRRRMQDLDHWGPNAASKILSLLSLSSGFR